MAAARVDGVPYSSFSRQMLHQKLAPRIRI
jgi:hypothetical protein